MSEDAFDDWTDDDWDRHEREKGMHQHQRSTSAEPAVAQREPDATTLSLKLIRLQLAFAESDYPRCERILAECMDAIASAPDPQTAKDEGREVVVPDLPDFNTMMGFQAVATLHHHDSPSQQLLSVVQQAIAWDRQQRAQPTLKTDNLNLDVIRKNNDLHVGARGSVYACDVVAMIDDIATLKAACLAQPTGAAEAGASLEMCPKCKAVKDGWYCKGSHGHEAEPQQAQGEQELWYVGAQNDALYIINKPPRPSNDGMNHEHGPTMAIMLDGLPLERAQEICNRHNAAVRLLIPADQSGSAQAVAWRQIVAGNYELFKSAEEAGIHPEHGAPEPLYLRPAVDQADGGRDG